MAPAPDNVRQQQCRDHNHVKDDGIQPGHRLVLVIFPKIFDFSGLRGDRNSWRLGLFKQASNLVTQIADERRHVGYRQGRFAAVIFAGYGDLGFAPSLLNQAPKRSEDEGALNKCGLISNLLRLGSICTFTDRTSPRLNFGGWHRSHIPAAQTALSPSTASVYPEGDDNPRPKVASFGGTPFSAPGYSLCNSI